MTDFRAIAQALTRLQIALEKYERHEKEDFQAFREGLRREVRELVDRRLSDHFLSPEPLSTPAVRDELKEAEGFEKEAVEVDLTPDLEVKNPSCVDYISCTEVIGDCTPLSLPVRRIGADEVTGVDDMIVKIRIPRLDISVYNNAFSAVSSSVVDVPKMQIDGVLIASVGSISGRDISVKPSFFVDVDFVRPPAKPPNDFTTAYPVLKLMRIVLRHKNLFEFGSRCVKLEGGAKTYPEQFSVADNTTSAFRFSDLAMCDPRNGKSVACGLLYRGYALAKGNNDVVGINHTRRTVLQFVDWCPTEFKCGISRFCPPAKILNNGYFVDDSSDLGGYKMSGSDLVCNWYVKRPGAGEFTQQNYKLYGDELMHTRLRLWLSGIRLVGQMQRGKLLELSEDDIDATMCADSLDEFKFHLSSIKHQQNGFRQWPETSSVREVLKLLLDPFYIVFKVELKELSSVPADDSNGEISGAEKGTTQPRENGTRREETQSLLWERITQDMPFIQNREKRLQSANLLLNGRLLHCLRIESVYRDEFALAVYHCGRYAAIDNMEDDEEIFRATVMAPMVQKILAHGFGVLAGAYDNELGDDFKQFNPNDHVGTSLVAVIVITMSRGVLKIDLPELEPNDVTLAQLWMKHKSLAAVIGYGFDIGRKVTKDVKYLEDFSAFVEHSKGDFDQDYVVVKSLIYDEGSDGGVKSMILINPVVFGWCTLVVEELSRMNGSTKSERSVAHPDGYTSAAFHLDGLILGTDTFRALVKIWDVTTVKNIASLVGHVGPITVISSLKNGYLLATSASDGVKLWDLHKLRGIIADPTIMGLMIGTDIFQGTPMIEGQYAQGGKLILQPQLHAKGIKYINSGVQIYHFQMLDGFLNQEGRVIAFKLAQGSEIIPKEKIDLEMGVKIDGESSYSIPARLRHLNYDDLDDNMKPTDVNGKTAFEFLFSNQEGKEPFRDYLNMGDMDILEFFYRGGMEGLNDLDLGVLISPSINGSAIKLFFSYGWSWEVLFLLGPLPNINDLMAVMALFSQPRPPEATNLVDKVFKEGKICCRNSWYFILEEITGVWKQGYLRFNQVLSMFNVLLAVMSSI